MSRLRTRKPIPNILEETGRLGGVKNSIVTLKIILRVNKNLLITCAINYTNIILVICNVPNIMLFC